MYTHFLADFNPILQITSTVKKHLNFVFMYEDYNQLAIDSCKYRFLSLVVSNI